MSQEYLFDPLNHSLTLNKSFLILSYDLGFKIFAKYVVLDKTYTARLHIISSLTVESICLLQTTQITQTKY